MRDASYDEALAGHRNRPYPNVTHDFLVFIGRFQPFHLAHLNIIQEALNRATKVIVLVGSAHASRSYRNPWTFDERVAMIRGAFDAPANDRIIILPLEDHVYNNNRWLRQVQELVDDVVVEEHDFAHDPEIGLIGHNKDNTSYYLKQFPQWSAVNVENHLNLAATNMRDGIFSNICESWLAASTDVLPENVVTLLKAFYDSPVYAEILDEYLFIRDYRQAWAEAPFPPTFITTDAVVVQAGHVLLIRRGQPPGKGLWALPGGFLKPTETVEQSMLRELREETRIHVPNNALRQLARMYQPRVFDDPHRDPRGRFITHAFLIAIEPNREKRFKLPEVKGSDDADDAKWVPQGEIRREDLFLDHFDIIENMVAQL